MITGSELLLPEDRRFLERKGWACTVTPQPGGGNDIIIHNWSLPETFSPQAVDMLVKQPASYPDGGMDMFWTDPPVRLAGSGQFPQAADVFEEHAGRRWQRWSRHTTWRPGTDCLETFVASIQTQLKK